MLGSNKMMHQVAQRLKRDVGSALDEHLPWPMSEL